MTLPPYAPAEPWFMGAGAQQRYCLFHAPAGICRGALLYVHPFGDEMNRTRHAAAQQARALAARGIGVLQIDLHGCGDSAGEFADARWDGWKQDLARAHAWLQQRLGQPVGLWGLRLGALLALDYARAAAQPPARLVLWQPVTSGAAFLTQFLRLRTAAGMLAGDAEGGTDTASLRAALQAGQMLEIGGYQLAAALALAIDASEARAPLACPVDWFEVVAAAQRPAPPGAQKLAAAWRQQGAAVTLHAVAAPSFWATQEIADCPALIAATGALFDEAGDAR